MSAWSLHLAVAGGLLAAGLGSPREHRPLYLEYREARPCPQVAPWPDFDPSVLQKTWLVGAPFCSYIHITANNTHIQFEHEIQHEGQPSQTNTQMYEMISPTTFGDAEMQYTLIDGKPEEYIMFHVCLKYGSRLRGNGILTALTQHSADLPSIIQRMEQEMIPRSDIPNTTYPLHPLPSPCAPNSPTPPPSA